MGAAHHHSSFMREYRWTILKTLPLGVFLPMSIFFGSVGPDDFVRNYVAWARKWGLTDIAAWFDRYATGPRIFWSVIVITALYLFIAFALPFLIQHTRKKTAAVIVPVAVAVTILVAAYGQYALSFPAERHLTAEQIKKIEEVFNKSDPPFKIMVFAVESPEAITYGREFMIILHSAGQTINGKAPDSPTNELGAPLPGRIYATQFHGILVGAKPNADLTASPEAIRFHDALVKAGFAPMYLGHEGLGPEGFNLFIGPP
jgi:hypothetical protein